jgi:predicted kinase
MPQGTTETRRRLVVFMGLIASGKSYLARAWAARHGCRYFNTDVVRKGLAGIEATTSRAEGTGQGIYSAEYTCRTYEAMRASAEESFRDPAVCCVALDGSYQAAAERDRLRGAFEQDVRVVFVMCSCREAVTKARLAERAADPTAVSDGRWEIYLAQRDSFESPEELPADQLHRLDTDGPLDALLARLDAWLQQGEN